MRKISNDKSKYVRRGVASPKRDLKDGKERDMKIDDSWHVVLQSPDVHPESEAKGG